MPTSPSGSVNEVEEPEIQTAREFLSKYYGNAWPEIQDKIERAKKISLDIPFILTPWEEVADGFQEMLGIHEDPDASDGIVRSRLRWPEVLTVEFIQNEYGVGPEPFELTEEDLPEIEALVAQKNEEMEELARQWVEQTNLHVLECWRSGRYLKAPFTTAGLSDALGFFSQSIGGHGWAVTITLMREDFPDIVELEAQAQACFLERVDLLYGYLRARARR